jgi:hypothetical protein
LQVREKFIFEWLFEELPEPLNWVRVQENEVAELEESSFLAGRIAFLI